jgi:hypothetical protein
VLVQASHQRYGLQWFWNARLTMQTKLQYNWLLENTNMTQILKIFDKDGILNLASDLNKKERDVKQRDFLTRIAPIWLRNCGWSEESISHCQDEIIKSTGLPIIKPDNTVANKSNIKAKPPTPRQIKIKAREDSEWHRLALLLNANLLMLKELSAQHTKSTTPVIPITPVVKKVKTDKRVETVSERMQFLHKK